MPAARSSSAIAVSRVSPASWGTASSSIDAGVAHVAEGVGVDGVTEQVQHRELAAFSVGEGVGEPVGQGTRPATGSGPKRGVFPASSSASPARSRSTTPGSGTVVARSLAEGLADEDGDGQRVARGVAQQRPPVDPRISLAVPFGQGGSQLEALAHRHRRQHPAGRAARRARLVEFAAGGQQHLALRLPWQGRAGTPRVVLLGLAPGAAGAGREPGDRLDVVPHPQHRHPRQHLHDQVPAAGRGLVTACQAIPFASSSPEKQSPAASQQPVHRQVMLEARPQHHTPADGGVDPGRRWPGTSGRTPPPWRLSAPANACSSTTAGRRTPGPAPAGSHPGRRTPHPAAGHPDSPAPLCRLCRRG